MNEPNKSDFEFTSVYFGFRVRVSILPPSTGLHVHRLAARGISFPDDPDSITDRYVVQVSRAVAGVDVALLKELAEEQGIHLNVSMETPEGSIKPRKVRGHYEPDFSYRRGRAKDSHRKDRPVTYERIRGAILSFKNNDYGEPPTRKRVAEMLQCSATHIKDVLKQSGERRRWDKFAEAVLNE
jgi:hypothetical protein